MIGVPMDPADWEAELLRRLHVGGKQLAAAADVETVLFHASMVSYLHDQLKNLRKAEGASAA